MSKWTDARPWGWFGGNDAYKPCATCGLRVGRRFWTILGGDDSRKWDYRPRHWLCAWIVGLWRAVSERSEDTT